METDINPIRTPPQIATDGGHKGATVTRKGRTGEQAQADWEQEHGSLDVPAYKRQKGKGKRQTGREAFSEQ